MSPPENRLRAYFRKWRGSTAGSPPRVNNSEILWSWLGAFAGIGLLAWLGQYSFSAYSLHLLIGSFGASAVLLFGAPRSPLAQPRNLLGGHALSAAVGVICWQLLHNQPVLAQALAVASAIALMHLTDTLHPPGGATALIAVTGSPQIQALGYKYAVVPVAAGAAALLVVALLVNNIPRGRRYPRHWW